MSIKSFLSRNNAEPKRHITYDSVKLEEFVSQWIQDADCVSEEDFIYYLEQVGIKSPSKFTNYKKRENSFHCVTRYGEEFEISLNFRDLFENYPKISVIKGDVTEIYEVDFDSLDAKNTSDIKLIGKVIKRFRKELKCSYNKYFCYRTLKLDNDHVLKVQVDEPKYPFDDGQEIRVLRNSTQIEDYLLDMDPTEHILQIYNKIVESLNFSSTDLEHAKRVMISYLETVNEEKEERSKILVVKGKIQEYAIFEDGETYHVFNNGNWRYVSETVTIEYRAQTQKYVFAITGEEDILSSVHQKETLERVKKRISKMWHIVK